MRYDDAWTKAEGLTGPEYHFKYGGSVMWSDKSRTWEYWRNCRMIHRRLTLAVCQVAAEELYTREPWVNRAIRHDPPSS